MKNQAFVLLTCVPDEKYKTKDMLDDVPQIKNAHILKGAYDIILKIRTSSIHELKEIVWKIRRLPTVRATLTLKTHI